MTEDKPKTITLREGEFLTPAEGAEIVRACPVSVVVVAGMERSGKTTFVGELYGLFHKGPFGGFLFGGSRTLPGFERRCHLARLCSERDWPDTERTGFKESHDLLHLQICDSASRSSHEILFSDIYGEDFRHASDSVEECQKITVLKRADHVVILVDGLKAVDKRERQGAFAAADSLLRQCLDSGMLGATSNVQIVVSKWDLIVGTADAFIDEKLNWLYTRHQHRLAALTTHKTALRTTGQIKAGHGMAVLLQQWVKVQSHYQPPPSDAPSDYYSEFDRLDVTWNTATGRNQHE